MKKLIALFVMASLFSLMSIGCGDKATVKSGTTKSGGTTGGTGGSTETKETKKE